MVKKNRNRQTPESPSIQNGGDSGESGDQKKSTTNCRCQHVQKAIQLPSVKKNLKNGCLASDCPGCVKDCVKTAKEEGSQSLGLWLCLQCGHQGCGRTENQHALKHYNIVHSDPHCVAVNTTTWNVWCYSCEAELPCEYRKKLQECVKYLKNLDCPPSVREAVKCGSTDGSKEMESSECSSMPLTDVTNMPFSVRAPKKKIVSLPRVRGLHNLGNTCFFNSVMQCLAQTPHFLELLQETQQGGTNFCLPGGKGLLIKAEKKKKDEDCEDGEGEGEGDDDHDDELAPLEGTLTKWGTLTEILASTLEELRQDDPTAVNPRRLFYKLTAKCPQFGGGGQHDAHELLRHLLDEVRTEDLRRYCVAILEKFGLSRHDTNETVEASVRARVRAYGRQAGELQLLPDPVFKGILVSTVECQDCFHSYQRPETFYELSLPVTTIKPQPPGMRRKTGGEDSFEVNSNVTNDTPSKHQLKKERKQQRKGRKKHQQHQQQPQKNTQMPDSSAGEPVIAEEARSTSESEQSDADVEDNVEQERAKNGDQSKVVVCKRGVSSRKYEFELNQRKCEYGVNQRKNDKVDDLIAQTGEVLARSKIQKESVVEQNGSLENLNEKTTTEGALEKHADKKEKGKSPKKVMNIKENGEVLNSDFIKENDILGITFNSECIAGPVLSQKFIQSTVSKNRSPDKCKESGNLENLNEKTITEGVLGKLADVKEKGKSPKKVMNIKENGEELSSDFIKENDILDITFDSECIAGSVLSQKFNQSTVSKNKFPDKCKENGNIEDGIYKNKTFTENRLYEQTSNTNLSMELTDLYNNLFTAKETPQNDKDNSANKEKHDLCAQLKMKKEVSQSVIADESFVEQNGHLENLNEKTITEGALEKHADIEEKRESPKKTMNIEENEEVLERAFIEKSNTVGVVVNERFDSMSLSSQKSILSNSLEDGVPDKCKENGDIEDRIDETQTIVENGIYEQTSSKNETLELLDSFNDLPSAKKTLHKETPSEDLLLSVSTTINSPNVLGSPMSNTGSPSSVSSDMNVELSTSNHLAANNWSIEEADRPFSRIAFCNDENVVKSSNNTQKRVQSAGSSFNSNQKSPSTESGDKETASSEQLVKEMAAMSLAHDECQSPSHWDTCSANSLEDLKDSKLALPLEVVLCNGVGNSDELDPRNDVDKSCTLAPRYSCEDKECSIESCLNQFTMLELMTGSCKVICENCSERINKGKEGKMVATNSTKQYLVSNPPAVLVLHLKRFEVQQNMFCKTPRHVTFPMLLDIAPVCNKKCQELPTIRKGQTKVLYSLYGVVQHSGSLHGGHYSAYVKVRAPVKRDDMRWCFLPDCQSSEKLEEMSKGASIPTEPLPGKWYYVSDSRVNEVNEDRVLQSQAYLLFYERVW